MTPRARPAPPRGSGGFVPRALSSGRHDMAPLAARSAYNPARLTSFSRRVRMNSRMLSGVALAAAAAVMFSTAAVSTATADEAKVKCEGVNSCKGHSACKSANNACKGQNSCKGKGFMEMTKAECDAAKAKAK
jgi:uncharacterized membrane protein